MLVWLNYKNAYEYWTELRLAQVKEVPGSSAPSGNTLQIPEESVSVDASARQAGSGASGPAVANPLGTLFLSLTVDDLGICLPIGSTNQVRHSIVCQFLLNCFPRVCKHVSNN